MFVIAAVAAASPVHQESSVQLLCSYATIAAERLLGLMHSGVFAIYGLLYVCSMCCCCAGVSASSLLGCALAFRATTRQLCMPLRSSLVLQHDV
jgi:hypothetical protein